MDERGASLAPIKWFGLVIIILAVTNIAILLEVPVLREVSGFIFLTFIPGFLLLSILKLNRLGLVEKIVLSVGLSVAFSMFFGLVINGSMLALDYTKPLSTIPLLISFSIATIILAIIAYIRNRDITFSLSVLKLTTGEKAFLIVPALLPLLSIVGMRIMNLTGNNVLPMLLLFLIPAYVIFISFYRHKVPPRVYPGLIFSIGISLLLMVALRSNHLLGSDIHDMYYSFQLTLDEGHWRLFTRGLMDACLSISLLPAVYQSFLNIDPEYLFKILYPLFFSVSPLVVYVIAKKYIGSFYALAASFFFMAQFTFLWAASSSNTTLAILFFALAIMVLFHDGISEFAKRPLFIIFGTSAIVSHYSTSYIFFFVLILTWLGMEIIPRILSRERKVATQYENPTDGSNPDDSLPGGIPLRNNVGASKSVVSEVPQSQVKSRITITLVALFFVILFFWYSQVTVAAFEIGVGVMRKTLLNLNQWYVMEAKGTTVTAAVGQGISVFPQQMRVVFSWLTVAFVATGVLTTMARYRRMVAIPNSGYIKPDFLQSKFEMLYVVLAMTCSAILVLSVVLPYVLAFYSMERTYFQMMAVLSPFFVIGGMMVAKWLRARPYWIILLVLVPFFLSTTGVFYQIQGYPASLILNSAGHEYARWYLHDQDSYAAKWIGEYGEGKEVIYAAAWPGKRVLRSQGKISYHRKVLPLIPQYQEGKEIDGYIYLRNVNITIYRTVTEYPDLFAGKSKIYTTGTSEVYR